MSACTTANPIEGNPECTDCGLHEAAQAVCLMGRGPIGARLMIIGEAPGRREDDVNKPFQGAAGKKLDKFLQAANIDRNDVFITNVVKCRPPGNRTPKAAEMKACRKYLDKEIECIKPKFIMLLGGTACKAFKKELGTHKITELHGKIVDHEIDGDKVYFLPTFHPASIFYDKDPKSKEKTIQKDFERFGEVIESGKYELPRLNHTVVKDFATFNSMVRYLSQPEITRFSFDLETSGLNPHQGGGVIRCLGIAVDEIPGDGPKEFVLPLVTGDSPWRKKFELQGKLVRILQKVLQSKKAIAHNGKFDNLWLRRKYGVFFRLTFDTMLAHYTLDENARHGLKILVQSELNGPNYDVGVDVKTGKGDLAKLYYYCALDVHFTLKLYHLLKFRLLKDKALTKLFKHVVMPLANATEIIEMNGVRVDTDGLDKLAFGEHDEATGKSSRGLYGLLADTESDLNSMVPKHVAKIQKKMEEDPKWGKKRMRQKKGTLIPRGIINWGASQQVAEVLFDHLGLVPEVFTDGDKPSTKESVLKSLQDKHPVVKQLLKHRELSQMISHFVEGWKKRFIETDRKVTYGDREEMEKRFFPSFKLHGTVTGRLSCVDPNLQQVPRDKRIRSLICARPGWTFVQADYSQVELRIAAMISQEPTMLRIFQTGGDIHVTTAMAVTGHDGSKLSPEDYKEWRKAAKAVNFGFLYGMGWKKFMEYAKDKYGVTLTPVQAKKFRRRFFELYPGLVRWHERQRRIVRLRGEVRSPSGRIRRLPGIYAEKENDRAKAERDAINSPVQGFGAELCNMAVIELLETFSPEALYENKEPKFFSIVGTVHDSILMEIRNDKLHKLLPRIHRIMKHPKLLDVLGIEIPVPIEVDIETGNWGVGETWNSQKAA